MESVSELKKICQADKRNKRFLLNFGYVIHRDLSIRLTWIILRFFPKVSPNTVSIMMIFIGLSGALILGFYEGVWNLLGIVLIYFAFLLDKVDGELARYKKQFSLRGMYLDSLFHLIVPVLFILALFYPLFNLGRLVILEIIFLIILIIFNRFNRRIPLILSVKGNDVLQKTRSKMNSSAFLVKFFNLFPIKIGSITTRFDLVVFSAFAVVFVDLVFSYDLLQYYLHAYLGLSLLHFIRWVVLYYNGHLRRRIKSLNESGY